MPPHAREPVQGPMMSHAMSAPNLAACAQDSNAERAPLYLNKTDLPRAVIPTIKYDPRVHEAPVKGSLLSRKRNRAYSSTGDLASLTREDSSSPGLVPSISRESSPGSSPAGISDKADRSPPPPKVGSVFDSTLYKVWDSALEQGLFRYDVTDCPTKVVEGEFGFVMQLNLGRATKKRPTEFSADHVVQDFDNSKFNFTKAKQDELVFSFETSAMRKSPSMAEFAGAETPKSSPNCVLINVSPIEYGHVLLVPRILDSLPQQLEFQTFHLALHMAAESGNEHFRVGFNSLGAYATINHLHFQGYYLYEHFPVELASTKLAFHAGPVSVATTTNYPVRTLKCTVRPGGSLKSLAATVASMCEHFQDNNMPYNLLISDCGRTVYVIPNRFSRAVAGGEVAADLLDTGVNPAVFEIAGHMVLKREEDYDQMDEDGAKRLLAMASLRREEFDKLIEAFSSDLQDDDY